MTAAIQEALLGLRSPGSFGVRRSLPAEDLTLELRGLGPISLPITAASSRDLISEAVRSPFGWRDQTITDLGVRDGWQIAKSRIKIDGRRWNPVLRAMLEDIRAELGLPASGRLRARLDKMTIYGPGQFFKAHQDTEKSDRMIGTLVVVLPSRYTGGTLRIESNGKRLDFRRSTRKAPTLDVIAFYSDCHHEIRPIKSGYRIALVYELDFDPGPRSTSMAEPSPELAARVGALTRAVETYFSTPEPVRHSRSGEVRSSEKLVYLLDHQYTRRNLGWARLKQADGARALALREAARALDLEAFLCLADVHETWQCEPTFRPYWDRADRWANDDDDDDDDDYRLGDLIDSDVALMHWLDASGAPASYEGLYVSDGELCTTTANDELEPFESEYQGFMGNYGDTLDRWYHRAAVVLWPRTHELRMLVKTDPEAAIEQVLASFGTKGPPAASAHADLQILLELLPRYAFRLGRTTPSRAALRLALAVDDPVCAADLLAPLRAGVTALGLIRPLLALAKHYGAPWCRGVLSTWHGAPSSPRPTRSAHPWSLYPPKWLARLSSDEDETGLALARFIVGQQWEELRGLLEATTPHRSRSPFARRRDSKLAHHAHAVLEGCTIVGTKRPHHAALRLLTSEDSPLSPVELAFVATRRAQALDRDEWSAWGLDVLLEHCHERLSSALTSLQREDGSWSITVPRGCSCRDCDELHDFLRSAETTHPWPLAASRRQHIHCAIDDMGLPVTHITRRQGRPYTLVLTKTNELFRLEARLRDEHDKSLVAVENLGDGVGRRGQAKRKARKTRARHR